MINVKHFVQNVQQLLQAFLLARKVRDPVGIHQSEDDWWDDFIRFTEVTEMTTDIEDPNKFDPEVFLNEIGSLQFREFMNANVSRMQRWHGENDPWVLSDWSNALAGEAGEACNVVKKIRRIDTGIGAKRVKKTRNELLMDLGEELADVLHYVFLTANHAGLDLEKFVIEKFNKVSEAEGFPERL